MKKKTAGRPPIYESAAEMEKAIQKYFKSCEGEYIKDSKGRLVTDKHGQPVKRGVRPLTITGLAYALGFTSRQALLNYQGKPEFVDTITRAKLYIEQYTEERLFDAGSNGARFSLTNNFSGWAEKREETVTAAIAPYEELLKEVTGKDEY